MASASASSSSSSSSSDSIINLGISFGIYSINLINTIKRLLTSLQNDNVSDVELIKIKINLNKTINNASLITFQRGENNISIPLIKAHYGSNYNYMYIDNNKSNNSETNLILNKVNEIPNYEQIWKFQKLPFVLIQDILNKYGLYLYDFGNPNESLSKYCPLIYFSNKLYQKPNNYFPNPKETSVNFKRNSIDLVIHDLEILSMKISCFLGNLINFESQKKNMFDFLFANSKTTVKPIDLSLTFHSSSEKQKETEGNLSKGDSSESYTFGDQNTIGKKSKRIDENDLTNKKIRLLSINSEQTIPSNSKSSSSNLSVRETRPIHPIKTIFSKEMPLQKEISKSLSAPSSNNLTESPKLLSNPRFNELEMQDISVSSSSSNVRFDKADSGSPSSSTPDKILIKSEKIYIDIPKNIINSNSNPLFKRIIRKQIKKYLTDNIEEIIKKSLSKHDD